MQPQRQIYDPALRANCGEMKDVSRQVLCSGLWEAHQSPGAPEQGHPWSLHTSLQRRVTNTSSSLHRNENLPQEMTGEEKNHFSLLSPRLPTAGKLLQRFFISCMWVCLSSQSVWWRRACLDSWIWRDKTAMTLKNMLMLRTKVKTCGFALFFFSRGTAEKQGYSS